MEPDEHAVRPEQAERRELIQISTPDKVGVDARLAGQLLTIIGKAYPNTTWPSEAQTGTGFVISIPRSDIEDWGEAHEDD